MAGAGRAELADPGAVLLVAASGSSSTGRPSASRASVEVRFSLERTPVAGGVSLRGEAILYNTTPKSILVEQCAADGWLLVGLRSRRIPFDPAMPLVACPPSIRLHPGANPFPVNVVTTYQECVEPGGQSWTPAPPCLPGDGPPPLPAGSYRTCIVTYGLPADTRMPRPIKVTVTTSKQARRRGVPRDQPEYRFGWRTGR